MEAFIGTIMAWAGTYEPMGWAFCNGQTLPIAQYSAVFAVLGTTYGGNGTTTFQLPDLRGRVIIGAGNGTGLTQYELGESGGSEANTLTASNMPAHTHALMGNTNTTLPGANTPGSTTVLSIAKDGMGKAINVYGNTSTTQPTLTPMNSQSIGTTGGGASTPISTIQPFQTINYIICLEGLFPPHN